MTSYEDANATAGDWRSLRRLLGAATGKPHGWTVAKRSTGWGWHQMADLSEGYTTAPRTRQSADRLAQAARKLLT